MSNTVPPPRTGPPSAVGSVALVDLDFGLDRLAAEDERDAPASIRLPVRTIGDGRAAVTTEFETADAFGAVVLTGVLVHEISLGDRTGLRLLGPGDVLVAPAQPDPFVVSGARWLPAGGVRLAMFNDRLLLALHRWPHVLVSLYARLGQQLDRLTAQLLICQLPRVEERVLAMMWLMAESWGKVTPAGTRLPLDLTHETIGMMIGARRPTVSLALRELADRGALIRHGDGWLLLQPLASMVEPSSDPDPDGPSLSDVHVIPGPELSYAGPTVTYHRDRGEDHASSHDSVMDAVRSLRAQHIRNVTRFETRLAVARATRLRCQQSRQELVQQRIIRRSPPPS